MAPGHWSTCDLVGTLCSLTKLKKNRSVCFLGSLPHPKDNCDQDSNFVCGLLFSRNNSASCCGALLPLSIHSVPQGISVAVIPYSLLNPQKDFTERYFWVCSSTATLSSGNLKSFQSHICFALMSILTLFVWLWETHTNSDSPERATRQLAENHFQFNLEKLHQIV